MRNPVLEKAGLFDYRRGSINDSGSTTTVLLSIEALVSHDFGIFLLPLRAFIQILTEPTAITMAPTIKRIISICCSFLLQKILEAIWLFSLTVLLCNNLWGKVKPPMGVALN